MAVERGQRTSAKLLGQSVHSSVSRLDTALVPTVCLAERCACNEYASVWLTQQAKRRRVIRPFLMSPFLRWVAAEFTPAHTDALKVPAPAIGCDAILHRLSDRRRLHAIMQLLHCDASARHSSCRPDRAQGASHSQRVPSELQTAGNCFKRSFSELTRGGNGRKSTDFTNRHCWRGHCGLDDGRAAVTPVYARLQHYAG